MVRKFIKKTTAVLLCAAVAAGLMGCGSVTSGKRIIRVSHAQSETHPEHIGLLAFKEYVEERLGDRYEVQIFPNEILEFRRVLFRSMKSWVLPRRPLN